MKRIGIILTSIMAVALAIGLPSQVSAAASNSLGVNPRRDYVIKAGDKISETLVVSNLSKEDDLIITIKAIDFGAKNQTGSPDLLLKREEPTRWSLKPYLTIPKNVTVAAGKSVEIPFSIDIPKNVGAGSYYSAIQYSTAGAADDQNLSLTSSSATLMFVRVPGEAKSSLVLKEFGAFIPNKDGIEGDYDKLFMGKAPNYVAITLKNQGNVAEQPTGSMVIRDIFGKEVKIFEKVNPHNNIVLIDQTRRIEVCLNEEFRDRKDPATGRNVEETKCNDSGLKPGRYTADLTMLYGDNGNASQEINARATFWYLPIWFLILVGVLLAVLAGVIWYIVRKLKSRGKRRNR